MFKVSPGNVQPTKTDVKKLKELASLRTCSLSNFSTVKLHRAPLSLKSLRSVVSLAAERVQFYALEVLSEDRGGLVIARRSIRLASLLAKAFRDGVALRAEVLG